MRTRVARAVAAALVVLIAIPTYVALPATWQPVAARGFGAAVLACACVRAMRWIRRSIRADGLSPLDAAPVPDPEPEVDAHAVALREDVIASTRQRRYFDSILWPRLLRLANGELAAPPRRGRRAPSLDDIEHLVRQLEGDG